MKADAVVRRIAQGTVVLCAIGAIVVANRHDWPDAVLIALVGAWALVTSRKMAWRLRRDRVEPSAVAMEIVNPLVLFDGQSAPPADRRSEEVS